MSYKPALNMNRLTHTYSILKSRMLAVHEQKVCMLNVYEEYKNTMIGFSSIKKAHIMSFSMAASLFQVE